MPAGLLGGFCLIALRLCGADPDIARADPCNKWWRAQLEDTFTFSSLAQADQRFIIIINQTSQISSAVSTGHQRL